LRGDRVVSAVHEKSEWLGDFMRLEKAKIGRRAQNGGNSNKKGPKTNDRLHSANPLFPQKNSEKLANGALRTI
jgi:hypothetical protein